MNEMPSADLEVDALGMLCPLPVLRAAKRLRGLRPGQVLRLETDDPAAVIDVPHFCNESGHELLGQQSGQGSHIWWIRHKP
ncbi:sulfurtransferase TusA family protein [Halocynthiibacter namhaensis]|uniref:sulfurtransferase TusA family protein n=1 Tax=Halocynthiibacter namhaensis TaxID=1290553 RepID=UPI001EE2D7F6|nr:sulfurtransferase TusA family protein [Halocynthiibacter namhaensis]